MEIKKKARNGSFGDDLCPNRGSPSIDAKTLLLMDFCLRYLAKIMYLQVKMMEAGSIQVSYLPMILNIHFSLIGRVVEVWILLERRLLPWCVAGVQVQTGSRFSTAWHGRKKSEDIDLLRPQKV